MTDARMFDPTDPKYCAGWGAGYRAAQADFEVGKEAFTASSKVRIEQLEAALRLADRAWETTGVSNGAIREAREAIRKALETK